MIKTLILLYILSFTIVTTANAETDTAIVRKHLVNITKIKSYRNFANIEFLNQTADYIYNEFKQYADTVYFQEYTVDDKVYKNVICSFGSKNKKTVVIGAHYDVCGNQQGADDNATGVVGLLELARQLKNRKLNYKFDLVAYTLEEPPYFRTINMGSYVHAKSLRENNIDVYGMVALEMIGFYKDERKTQQYPIGFLSLFYGNKGDYITLVNKFGKGKFARKFSNKFKHTRFIKTKKFTGPKILPGIDFSDHLNYWKFGISALMITDTAFYRNPNYHDKGDTMETLDILRMSKVIDSVFNTIITLK